MTRADLNGDEERMAERHLFTQLRASGDPELRARLIEEHLWLAQHVARRFNGRGEASDDLAQVASFALVKAVDRFDPAQGNRFATFAVPTMMGELRRHFRDKTWAMRVPRRIKDLHLDVRSMGAELTSRLGRSPTVDELAGALDVSAEQVLEALEAGAGYRTLSLDAPSRDDGSADPIGRLVSTDDGTSDASLRVTVQRALAGLPPRDREAVCLYYLGELTQSEIAERLDLSQVHVSRILRASLDKLRASLADDELVELAG